MVRRDHLVVLSVLAAALTVARVSSAAGEASMPDICDRPCWRARVPRAAIAQMPALTRAVIHHSATASDDNTTSRETSKAKVRAIQNYHMDVNGWSDIGYHFLVDKLGNSFEGRSGSMGSLPRGAHDGTNESSFGFVMMGYLHSPYSQQPSAAMRCALYHLIAWKLPDPFDGLGSGTYGARSSVGFLSGHRDVAATACPGDRMFTPYLGLDFYGGEARIEVNEIIATGIGQLCE
jgi:hypothetical protein